MNVIQVVDAADAQSGEGEQAGLAILGILILLYLGWRWSAATRVTIKNLVGGICILAALAAIGYAVLIR